jgi:hypothetical protein
MVGIVENFPKKMDLMNESNVPSEPKTNPFMKRTFYIVPGSTGVCIILSLLVVLFLFILNKMVSQGVDSWIPLLVGPGVLLMIVVLFGLFAYSARKTRFEISQEGLWIRGTIYGRKIPSESLILSGVKVLNIKQNRDYRPKWRKNGIGLPDYQTGWFRLQNKEKALLFVTDRTRVVYVPIKDQYSVLLSVELPDSFVQVLKESVVQM